MGTAFGARFGDLTCVALGAAFLGDLGFCLADGRTGVAGCVPLVDDFLVRVRTGNVSTLGD